MKTKNSKPLFFTLFLFFYINIISAQSPQKNSNSSCVWINIDAGMDYMECKATKESFVGDSKIFVLRISPEHFNFQLCTAAQNNGDWETAKKWSKKHNLVVAVNAGLFNKESRNVGYARSFTHFNNRQLWKEYLSIAAFEPVDSSVPRFQIIDLTCQNWDSLKTKYNVFTQSIHMIDSKSKPLYWNNYSGMTSSIVALGADRSGNVLIIFSRSPYSANELMDIALALPINLRSMMYLEGGPYVSLYINCKGFERNLVGSYEKGILENDKKYYADEIPNVIGIKKK